MGTADKHSAEQMLSELKSLYPNPHHYLIFGNPFQLLIATILSAQCTDEKVNAVTPGLFRRYRGPEDFTREPLEVIEEAIRPTGFFRNKAKAIRGASEALLERFDGKVPESMDDLVTLPGIARKSANAILQHGFGKVEGIVVDTHVVRVAGRLGWTRHSDPVKIERDLMELFDPAEWRWLPFYLKNHGRAVCRAPTPKCGACRVNILCPSALIEPPVLKPVRKAAADRKAAPARKAATDRKAAPARRTATDRKAAPVRGTAAAVKKKKAARNPAPVKKRRGKGRRKPE